METMERSNTAADVLADPKRRNLMAKAFGGAILAAAGLGLARAAQAQAAITDADILNFALNLEYLEGEYYTLAISGQTLDQIGIGVTGVGAQGSVIVKSNPKVPFTTTLTQQFAVNLAADEQNHVKLLRSALGSKAVAQPQIDLLNSFNTAAKAAGLGNAFDPFADEMSFLLGSFIFEDVGVTAYHGAAALIQDKGILGTAAGILAVEAYHAGSIRTRIFRAGQAAQDASAKIAALRAAASAAVAPAGTPTPDDMGVALSSTQSKILNADKDSIAFSRNTTQVLNIVTLGGGHTGGFFPNGINGTIK